MLSRPTPTTPPRDTRYGLDVDPAERETLLAALEIAEALASGDVTGARFLATAAYSGPILTACCSALADRVFRLGAPPAAVLPTQEVPARAASSPALRTRRQRRGR